MDINLVEMEKNLFEEYQTLFEKYKTSIAAIQQDDLEKQHFSKIFLPSITKEMIAKNRVMFIGRETRGWGISKAWQHVQRDDVRALMKMYLKDYQEGLPLRSRGVPGFLKRIQRIGIHPFWCNFLCVDYKKGSPYKQASYSAIKELSLALLSAQLKVFKPQYIITGYGRGVDGNRNEILKLLYHCGNIVEEESCEDLVTKEFVIKRVFEDGTALLDLYYHPAGRVKGSGSVRDKIVEMVKG